MNSNFSELNYYKGIYVEQWQRLFGCNGRCFITLVSLDGIREEMAREGEIKLVARYLTHEEQERFLSFSYPKRKIEWLGGRLAAKHAVMKVTGKHRASSDGVQLWLDWAVGTDENGRPYVRYVGDGSDMVLPDISISHNNGLAAAMAVIGGRCGVDIQKIMPSVLKIKERFASASEQDILLKLLHTAPESARLALLWAAKEALKKAVGAHILPGFMEIRLTNAAKSSLETTLKESIVFDFVRQADQEMKKNNKQGRLKVAALFHDEFALAFTGLSDKGI